MCVSVCSGQGGAGSCRLMGGRAPGHCSKSGVNKPVWQRGVEGAAGGQVHKSLILSASVSSNLLLQRQRSFQVLAVLVQPFAGVDPSSCVSITQKIAQKANYRNKKKKTVSAFIFPGKNTQLANATDGDVRGVGVATGERGRGGGQKKKSVTSESEAEKRRAKWQEKKKKRTG